ncbi:hypothetical protein F5Y14DRAFT_370112 [Nemania sp. NC0429]|nr:hypothetical protein F5Y14DRAFT_370112 [Nemania sp. NC0429]
MSPASLITYEKMAAGSGIPMGLWEKYTDPVYWGSDLSNSKAMQIEMNGADCEKLFTTYFAEAMAHYIRAPENIADFRDDFSDWTADHFKMVNRRFRREMVLLIDNNASYGPLPGESYADKLVRFLTGA